MSPLERTAAVKYSFVDKEGVYVLCWDHARFVNHSCEPNCVAPGYDLELAVRDIHPGEQLTDDYASLNLSPDFTCGCGGRHCRGKVSRDDFATLAPYWDAQAEAALRQLKAVPQPLWALVQDQVDVELASSGAAAMASCAVHRFTGRARTAA
jgi:hypothetical protein